MKATGLTYQIPGAKWRLHFSAAALGTLKKSVQKGVLSREAVGQLFTRDLTVETVEVEKATTLKPRWASFARVKFDPAIAMAERSTLFQEQALHCIGLWHTHPEPVPVPSAEDRELAKDHALAAKPQLAGLVFVIVGTSPFPTGLQVWIHDGHELVSARPSSRTINEGSR